MTGSVPWDIRVTLDLFLGGIGIGLFLFAAGLSFSGGARNRLVRYCAYLSPVLVGVGGLFLMTELGKPERFMSILFNFNPASVTAWGALAQGAFMALAVAYAFLLYKERGSERLLGSLEIAGVLSAVMVGVYHGLLLSSLGRPLWAGGMIAILFLASSLLGATSVVMLLKAIGAQIGVTAQERSEVAAAQEQGTEAPNFTYLFVVLTSIELALLIGWQVSIARFSAETAEAIAKMMAAYGTTWNLLVLGAGLAVPLFIGLAQLVQNRQAEMPKGFVVLLAGLVLIGSFALKHIIITAGQASLPFFI